MFILCMSPQLSNNQVRLSLILLDLYYKHKTERFCVDELYKHPLMTIEIQENLEQLLPTIIKQKIVAKYQPQYSRPPYHLITNPPELINYVFEYMEIIDNKVLLVVTNYYWDYITMKDPIEFDDTQMKHIDEPDSQHLFKFYLWVLTWLKRSHTTCNNSWLEMYLDLDDGSISENQLCFTKIVEHLKDVGIHLKLSFDSLKYSEKEIGFTTFEIVKLKMGIKPAKQTTEIKLKRMRSRIL